MPFDKAQSDKVKNFLTTYCRLSKDRWANKPIRLTSWQHSWIDNFYGIGNYIDNYWKRNYRYSSLWLPRKNGKSSILSGLAIHALLETPGNEVIVVASTIDQARIIYDEAAFMIERHPTLKKQFRTLDSKRLIRNTVNKSRLKIISSEPEGASGHNGSVILDEFAEWKPSSAELLWQKLKNTNASRTNGWLITISTAQPCSPEHPGFQRFVWSKEVLEDPTKDPQFLPVIYTCPDNLWDKEEGWRLANPALNDGILDINEIRSLCEAAKKNPREINAFKLFRLNIWAGELTTYIDPAAYSLAETDLIESDLHGCRVWAALDISRRHDLTGWVLLVEKEGMFYLLPRLFTPKDTLHHKSKQDNVDYQEWVNQGHIIATDGDRIKQEQIFDVIKEDAKHFDIQSITFDPWNADFIASKISEELGIECIEAPTNRPSWLAPPTGELERMFLSRRIKVPKNPVLAWNFTNAAVRQTGADGIHISKKHSTGRIDGCYASILAVAGYKASLDMDWVDPYSAFVV